jgi:hypothetical protein
MTHERKREIDSEWYKEIVEELENNPVVEHLEPEPIPGLTKDEHIKELQERLVQTCIDFINEKGLTDIYAVNFRADDLAFSAKYGEWTPTTDAYIKVEGIRMERYKRKNGEIGELGARYDIGERY